jgi:hypothetical protein
MNRSQFIIGCSLAAVALICVFLGAGLLVWQFLMPMIRTRSHEMPARLASPVVLIGSGLVSKNVWLNDPSLGDITDIQFGNFDAVAGTGMAVAGTGGAAFVDESGAVRSTVLFSGRTTNINIIDVDNDHVCEFLDRGGGGWQDAALLDHTGKVRWTCGQMSSGAAVDDSAAGDLDGDGTLEFVVGFNGGGGVRMFDEDGTQIWQHSDGNVWHVEIGDTDRDGKPEIIHSNAGGEITIRDATGSVVKRAQPPEYLSDFSLCPWPGRTDPKHILYATGGGLLIIAFDGTTKTRLPAPDCDRFGHARGIPVRLKHGEAEYLAVVVRYSNWNRSVFYLYDSAGKPIYEEVLMEPCAAIAVRSIVGSDIEAILLGGSNRVLEYRLAP